MNLYISTAILATLCLAAGLAFFSEKFKPLAFKFLRSPRAAVALFGAGIVWFVLILLNLSEADFGNYKFILIAIFGGAGLLAFKYLPDFLSVRGLSVVMLLALREFIDSAYMLDIPARLTMVAIAYVLVVAFIYFGCLPYRMRDLFEWLWQKSSRVKSFGGLFILAALSMYVSMIFY